MKVHLIKTPEYNSEDFRDVCELLSSFEGPMEFIPSFYEFDRSGFYFLEYDLYPLHGFKYPSNDTALRFNPEREYPLSWRELFSLCNHYRDLFNIEENSFVVLLTNRKNGLNWFSANDAGRNVFVHTAEWDYYTKVNSKYPIAYQVIENIMQFLMKIDIYDVPNQFIHEPLRGCMNDFCNNKSQIIIKLQTANVCPDCAKKIKNEGVSSKLWSQARSILDGIRNEFIYQEEEQPAEPVALVVDNKCKILIPEYNLEIKLTPLFKTLYLFFLSKPEGVTVSELCDYNEELLSIYKKLRPAASSEDADSRITKLSHPLGDGFNPTRSHINRTITSLLKEPLADFYRISGTGGNPYKINVPRTLIDIRY